MHTLSDIITADREDSVGRCVEIWAPVGIFG